MAAGKQTRNIKQNINETKEFNAIVDDKPSLPNSEMETIT